MAPIIDELDQNTDIEVLKINVDENFETAKDFGVSGVPTYVLFDDKGEVARVVGAKHKALFYKELGITL